MLDNKFIVWNLRDFKSLKLTTSSGTIAFICHWDLISLSISANYYLFVVGDY